MGSYVTKLVNAAKQSSHLVSQLDCRTKNVALTRMSQLLITHKDYIIKENKKDIAAARKHRLTQSFIDRLSLNDARIKGMSTSLKEIARFTDPINKVIERWRMPNGLTIQKVSVPIGVILIIYEARPNVTSDCIGLCFKSSNVSILRGGRNALHSNKAIVTILTQAIREVGIQYNPFFFVEQSDYKIVDDLLGRNAYIDLVIPRGGEALIKKVVERSSIPVIKHDKGICALFIDRTANLNNALRICINAKVQRPSVCNAVETILVHKNVAKKFLPLLKEEFDTYGVIIKGDTRAAAILSGIKKAKEIDWHTEYLDLIVSLKVVDDIDDAIAHINYFGSHHTDSIVTESKKNAKKFVKEVDSACCFVNISTRFSDGYQFGLGAEIGISTNKLHARGPMGVRDLTTYKYVVRGNGQIRES